MLVKINTRGLTLTEELLTRCDAKVRVALGLYLDMIVSVDITLIDSALQTQRKRVLCIARLESQHHALISVQDVGVDIDDVIDACMHRVKRVLSRRVNPIHYGGHSPSSF